MKWDVTSKNLRDRSERKSLKDSLTYFVAHTGKSIHVGGWAVGGVVFAVIAVEKLWC